MEADRRHFRVGDVVEYPPARNRRLLRIVVHGKVPFGVRQRHRVVGHGVRQDHQFLALAFDVIRHVPGGMAEGVDCGHTGDDIVTRLDEARAFAHRLGHRAEHLERRRTEIGNVLTFLPVVEVDAPKYDFGIGKGRLAVGHQITDMVGMTVGDDDDIDILDGVAGFRQQAVEPARRRRARVGTEWSRY